MKLDPNNHDMKQFTDFMGEDIAKMLADASQCCKLVIDGGMPGHSKWEELLEIINFLYLDMKDYNKLNDEKTKEEIKRGIPQA